MRVNRVETRTDPPSSPPSLSTAIISSRNKTRGQEKDISRCLDQVWAHVGCCVFCLLTLFRKARSPISDISTAQLRLAAQSD